MKKIFILILLVYSAAGVGQDEGKNDAMAFLAGYETYIVKMEEVASSPISCLDLLRVFLDPAVQEASLKMAESATIFENDEFIKNTEFLSLYTTLSMRGSTATMNIIARQAECRKRDQ